MVVAIFTNTIYNMGGGQLLTLRKAKLLKSMGYIVYIVYKKQRGPFLLENDFKEFESIFIPELDKPFNVVTKNRKRILISKMKNFLLCFDKETIFESHDIESAVWAEYFASKFSFRHIIYLIAETNLKRIRYYPYFKFCKYKLERNEFWGCNSEGLKLSFKTQLEQYENNYINVPFCADEIPQETIPNVDFGLWNDGNKIVISTISRFEKGYVRHLIDAVKEIAIDNKKMNFELLIIGGSIDNGIKESLFREKVLVNQNIKNCNVLITEDFIDKPGKDLFERTNIFVGMGTAIISAISQGCISIVVNPLSNKTAGVLGVQAMNFGYPINQQEQPLKEKILEVIFYSEKRKFEYSELSKSFFMQNYTLDSYWEKLNLLMEKVSCDCFYFEMKPSLLSIVLDCAIYSISRLKCKLSI